MMNAQEFVNLNRICRYCDTPRDIDEPCNCDGWQIEELRAENARLTAKLKKVKRITDDYFPDNDSYSKMALDEMRFALMEVVSDLEDGE